MLLTENVIFAFSVKELTELVPDEESGLYDLSVGDYLLRPLAGAHDSKELQREYLPGTEYREEPSYLSALSLVLGQMISEQLGKMGLEELYETIERPLIWVLADMERTGIYADPKLLAELDREFSAQCDKEEKTVFELAGTEFNQSELAETARRGFV